MLYMYPAGILDREDTLIYSLGLGSTGYDYSVITEPIYFRVLVLPQHHHPILHGEGDKVVVFSTVVQTVEQMAIYAIH